MGADSPPYPHAQPRRKGYRFIRKTPLRVVLFILAITRRGSLFGRHYSFVSPSLSCLNLWFWECFPASRLLTLILNGGLRPPCPLRSTFARLGLTLRSLVRKLTRSLRSRRKSSRSLAGIIVSFRPHYLV